MFKAMSTDVLLRRQSLAGPAELISNSVTDVFHQYRLQGIWRLVMNPMRFLAFAATIAAAQASAAGPLPYGPDTCKTGFVFRGAYPNDRVCVDSSVQRRVIADNAAARSNIQPGGGASGPNTCKEGLVWRLARPQDLVCVSPEQRTQAQADNRFAYSRKLANARVLPKLPKRMTPVDLGADGRPVTDAGSGTAMCKRGGAKCPPRFMVSFDENVGCVCREQ